MKPDQVHMALWRRMILAALRVKVRFCDVYAVTSGAPMILTCNHQSLLDGLILAFACPTKMVFPVTPKHSVDNVFTSYGLRLLEWLGLGWVVPMNSNHPYALRHLQSALEAGRSVAIFPEGRIARPDQQLPHRAGVQWLQDRTGAPVVRARLTGADQSRLFARAGTRFRPEITLDLGGG
ncbi:lysophospholipid acyltransferase family protein [uncultured Roseobacter sp.]|uniref:lysophospholipid acyltransferase family protein n=1 Tax=uncultured Roseobacter sp. TaxID=114847 RepID=UPI0026363E6B|nr:lysophospholipid acyltransferase family protein [uncultured Roseobacter sp.]